jgi:rhodanese-related sulfurtransferase
MIQISVKSISLFVVALLFAANSFAQDGAPKLSPEEFQQLSQKSKKSVILDIRTPEETAEGHLEGASFINFLGEDFEKQLLTLNKKKTYYVYCRSAKRTIPATEKMMALGFKKVFMLEGGINNWIEQGKPVVKPQ